MVEQPMDLAKAEELARWAAMHDGWNKTREMLGVLLAEYKRRGEALAVLRELVELKDGPRDEHYREVKEAVWARARAVVAAAGPSTPAPADLLRRAAAGRREYAGNAPDKTRDVLLTEASTFEQAARIVEGDRHALRGALPSWRWDEPSTPAPATSEPDEDVEEQLTEALSRIVDLLGMADDVAPAEIVAEVRRRVAPAPGGDEAARPDRAARAACDAYLDLLTELPESVKPELRYDKATDEGQAMWREFAARVLGVPLADPAESEG